MFKNSLDIIYFDLLVEGAKNMCLTNDKTEQRVSSNRQKRLYSAACNMNCTSNRLMIEEGNRPIESAPDRFSE